MHSLGFANFLVTYGLIFPYRLILGLNEILGLLILGLLIGVFQFLNLMIDGFFIGISLFWEFRI